MGLVLLVVGLVLFIGGHAFVSLRAERAAAVARLGEGGYKLLFSLVAAAGLVLIVYGFGLYRAGGYIEIWSPPAWTRHLAAVLMWPAIVLVLAAYLPGHIKRLAKHPLLAAVKLWALAHLLANGDLGSIILFGSFLAWAVYDRIAVKKREQGGEIAPEHGMRESGGWRNDLVAVVVGSLVYLALGYTFHPLVVGVPAFAS